MKLQFPTNPPVVVVTGAGRGIGRSIAETFAAEGAKVAVNDINSAGVEETVALLRNEGATCLEAVADITSYGAVQAMYAKIHKVFGPVSVVVNNAAWYEFIKATDQSDESWHRTWAVEIDGMWNMVRGALPHMQETGAGVVINIASANAFFTIPQNTAYAGAKAGIVGLTRGLALELGPQNIRVLSISPGLIATPAIREYVAALDPEKRATEMGRYDEQIPLRRIGQPEEVANLCVFLASDKAAFIHGTDISCDGGMWALNKAFSYTP